MYPDCSINQESDLSERVPAVKGSRPQAGRAPAGDVRESAPLSTTHIRPQIIYKAGSSILKSTKGEKMAPKGGGIRGNVSGFSKQSRHRLMVIIGGIRRNAELPSFVTLTYPCEFPSVEKAKRDLKIFLQRLNRKFGGAGFIWKLEPQKRGAPHYHLLVWGVDNSILYGWVLKNWHEIAGNGDRMHYLFHAGLLPDTQKCVTKVYSWKGVWSYASKYLGKTFDVAEWGQKWTGRFWGIGNRVNIPFGEDVVFDTSWREVVKLMRFQRRFSGIKKGNGNSLTIFCDADQWISKLDIKVIST